MSKTPEPLDLVRCQKCGHKLADHASDADRNLVCLMTYEELREAAMESDAEIRRLRSLLSTMEARAPLPPPPVWRMRPTVSGWYWYKEPDPKEPAVPACVNVEENWFTIFGINGQCSLSENALSNAWAGPIPSPTEGPKV